MASAVTFIVGATASGKSELALTLARKRKAEILVMDSMQVYRGANIGTSKPTVAEQKEIRHGGIDLVDIGENFDVGQYLQYAKSFLDECRQRHQPVIIVGGIGLYFRALTRGLCEAPNAPAELRKELAGLSVPELQSRLSKIDPEILSSLDQNNPRRLARAIEVKEFTGLSLRDWQQKSSDPLVPDYHAYVLQRSKEDLQQRIEHRVDAMLASGFEEEVRVLIRSFGTEKIGAFLAIGYPELTLKITGKMTAQESRSQIVISTRQYAKRQLTWFRTELTLRVLNLTTSEPSSAAEDRVL